MNTLNDYLLLVVSLLLIATVVSMLIIVRKKNDYIAQVEYNLENLYRDHETLTNHRLGHDVGEATALNYSDDIMALINATKEDEV